MDNNGKDLLKHYGLTRFNRPSVAVDMAVFTVHEEQLKVLLIKRGVPPYVGKWALPGGFINKARDRTVEDTVLRELREETGAIAPYIEQLYTFGSADRDPRDWTVSIAYFALTPYDRVNLKAGTDAQQARWWPVRDSKVNEKLAFDHNKILAMAIARLRSKLEYTAIAGHLLGTEFTLPQLQATYEIILGEKLDKTAFRRNLHRAEIVQETRRTEEGVRFRMLLFHPSHRMPRVRLAFARDAIGDG